MKKILLLTIVPLLIFGISSIYAESELTNKSIFDLLVNPPEELLPQFDIPVTSAGDELEAEFTSAPSSCKSGLYPVVKASDNSPACVKPTSIFKLIERNWMFVQEAFAQTNVSEKPDIVPNESERAMYYTIRASGGQLEREIATNFHKFVPFTSEESHITPDNPTDLKSKFKFSIESLPSKDKIEFYRLVGEVIRGSNIADEPFDVNVDVVAGDGTVIHTWAYRNCQIENYVTYLQDTVFFYQFSGEQTFEIRERAIFECRGLELEIPEN